MIFAKKKILVWCDDPPEDRVISIVAGCLANHDRAHSHWTRLLHKVVRQLNIPTMSTPAFSYVLCLDFICSTEKVRQLLNRPVVSLFDTRMNGTSTEMVSHLIQLKLPATTSRQIRICLL